MYSVHPVRQNQTVSKPVWPQNHQTSIESCAQCPLEALRVSCASQSCGSDNSYPTVSWVIGPVHRRLTWYDGKKWQAAIVTCKMQGITTSVFKHKVFQERESVFVKATFEYRSHFQEKTEKEMNSTKRCGCIHPTVGTPSFNRWSSSSLISFCLWWPGWQVHRSPNQAGKQRKIHYIAL